MNDTNETAQTTETEAEREALNAYVRETIDDPAKWEDVTPDYSKPAAVSLRLPTPLLARVRSIADDRGIGYTSLMREWIEQRVAVEDGGAHAEAGMDLLHDPGPLRGLAMSVLTYRELLGRSAEEFSIRTDKVLTFLAATPEIEGWLKLKGMEDRAGEPARGAAMPEAPTPTERARESSSARKATKQATREARERKRVRDNDRRGEKSARQAAS